MEAVRCIRLRELRGLMQIPYVALQDTRHGYPGGNPSGHHSTLPAGGRAQQGCGVRPNVHVTDLDPADYHAPGRTRYPAGGTPYIVALGLEGVLQGSGKMGVDRPRQDRFAMIYGTTQSDNAVQDTKRSASLPCARQHQQERGDAYRQVHIALSHDATRVSRRWYGGRHD